MKAIKLAVVAALLGGTAIVAPLADADAAISQCKGGYQCLWGNNDFDWLLSKRTAGKGLYNLPSSINNRMDSWANTTTTNGRGHDNANGRGSCQTFWASSNDNNVNPLNSDEVSSTYTNGAC